MSVATTLLHWYRLHDRNLFCSVEWRSPGTPSLLLENANIATNPSPTASTADAFSRLSENEVRIRAFGPLVDPHFDKRLDQKWIEAMVERLVRDGLVIRQGAKITLCIDSIKVGAGVVIIRDGQTILAMRRCPHAEGYYGSLGGHVELNDSTFPSVYRDLKRLYHYENK